MGIIGWKKVKVIVLHIPGMPECVAKCPICRYRQPICGFVICWCGVLLEVHSGLGVVLLMIRLDYHIHSFK